MAHDVLVLGATVAGLTVARRLAHRGYDVVVLDPNREAESAAVGHGVAAVGHASTIANMAHAYGIEAAAQKYFGKSAKAVSLSDVGAVQPTDPDAAAKLLQVFQKAAGA